MNTLTSPPKGQFILAGRFFPRKQWWKDHNMRILYMYIGILILTNTANGFDNSMMNGLQSLVYWRDYFHHPTGSVLGLFNCVMSAGALCGLVFLPWFLDHMGRRPCLGAGAIIMLIGIALQSAANGFPMFVAGRFILGFGDIIVIVTAPLLITEIAPVQDRAILVTIAGATYFSGAFIAAWTTYGTLRIQSNWAWRAPSLIQALFTFLLLGVAFWIPESPRFLVNKDKPDKALAILAKYHANGDAQDEVVQLEYAEICSSIALEKAAKNSASYLDFFRTPGNRRRALILISIGLFSQWSGNGLISYYLNLILNSIGITDSNEQLLINGAMTTFNLVTNTFFCFFVDRWGRRPIYLVSTVGTLIAYIIWTVCSARYSETHQQNYASGVLAMIFVYSLAYNIKSGLLASYATEILPYNLRAKGYILMEYMLYGALFFNQYVNPIALEALQWKYYIIYCVFLLFECFVVYFLFVETRYVPLEEIRQLFDGGPKVIDENLEKGAAEGDTVRIENITAAGKHV